MKIRSKVVYAEIIKTAVVIKANKINPLSK